MLYFVTASRFQTFALKAIPAPPEAEPIILDKPFVVIAPFTRGLLNICEIA
jgi:hypothetical protein